MAYDTTEQEQVETLKRFWSENGKQLIVGAVVGLSIFIGYQSWSTNQQLTAEAASMEYMNMMDNLASNNLSAAAEHGSRIIGSFSDTTYAPLSALAMARIKLEQGDSVTARAHLNWSIEHSEMPEIQNLARIRLAAILLDEELPEQALTTLNKVEGEYYDSLKNEVLGDVYVALQSNGKAQQAYNDSLAQLPEGGSQRSDFIQMKLDDIAGL